MTRIVSGAASRGGELLLEVERSALVALAKQHHVELGAVRKIGWLIDDDANVFDVRPKRLA